MTADVERRAAELAAALVRDELRGAPPYTTPHPAGIEVKLDANELPAALPPELTAELAAELAAIDLHRYPDPEQRELRAAIGARIGVDPSALVCGNGSDELIQLLISCYARPREGLARAAVAYPVPSFAVFRGATLIAGADPVEIPLEPDFTLDFAVVERAVVERRPNLVFFARPNNPTGTLWPSREVAALARAHPDTIIVSDEAYAAFAGDGMLADVPSLPNLVVMQTLSKTGMASLRVGYLHAAAPILAEIEKVRMPYNVGALNQRAAIWMLRRCRDLLAARCAEVVRERERLATAMARLPGVRVFPSQANLLLFGVGEPGDHAATRAWQGMVDRGVLVRLFDRPGPLAGCARVTIGSPAENDRFLAALAASLPAALARTPG